MGYSRNSALPPFDGYTPDTVYVECGNPFATLNPSDFAVIVTMKEGSAFWNGEHTAYKAIEVSSQTGGITLTTNGGVGAINIRDDVYFGRDFSPSTAHYNLSNSRFRVRERASLGQVSLATNIANMGAPLDVDVVKDDDDAPSWELSFGASDYFDIRRTDIGANKKAVELFRIQSNGAICSSVTGNPEGAIGAPVGALYPSGNGKLYFKASGSGVTGWREVVLA